MKNQITVKQVATVWLCRIVLLCLILLACVIIGIFVRLIAMFFMIGYTLP